MFKQKLELIKSKIIDKITDIRVSSRSDNADYDEVTSKVSDVDKTGKDFTDIRGIKSEELDDIEELDLEEDLEKLKQDAFDTQVREPEVDLEKPSKKKKKKKKKSSNGKSKMIQAFIGLILVYMLVDEVFLKDNEETGEEANTSEISRKNVAKRPRTRAKPRAQAQAEAKAKAENKAKQFDMNQDKIADKKAKTGDEVKPVIIKNKIINNEIITNTNKSGKEEARDLKKRENEQKVEKQKDELRAKKEKLKERQQELEIELAKKNKDKEDKKLKESNQLQQAQSKRVLKAREELLKTGFDRKIKAKTVFIDPPEFAYAGRGLVYNCTGKHWACVDKSNFLQCRQNMNWNLENKKGISCVVKDVYASYDDCKIVQIYNINENVEIKECQ